MTPPEPTRIREVRAATWPISTSGLEPASPGARGLSRLEREKGLGAPPPFVVGDRAHGALEHRGVRGHRLLDLDRRDILAAGDEDVLLPVAQLDIAVGVPPRDVARMEPPAA